MGFYNTLDISASGITAQRLRMDVIAQNIANVDTTRTEDGTPYKRKTVIFEERQASKPFSAYFDDASLNYSTGGGIRAVQIAEDQTEGTKVYDPSHPDSDDEGYVTKPNVNIVEEMVNMIASSRSYEASVTATGITKSMITKTLELSTR